MIDFANLESADAVKPTKGKAKKDDAVPTSGLHLYAALRNVLTNVEAQIAVVETEVKGQMATEFVARGMKHGCKPESYKGEENGSKGSLQLRCRSSRSLLTEDEQELLNADNIPMGETVTREETFIFNPEYADLSNPDNAKMFADIQKALSKIKGLPKNLILKQSAIKGVIATDESIDAVCALEDQDKVEALLPLVTTMAIRATLAPGANAFEVVENALGSPEPVKAKKKAA